MPKIPEAITNRWHSPESWTTLTQLVKMVIAATAAWWVSTAIFDAEFPFLAPWMALMTVHATAYRTLSRATQATLASLLGIAVAFAVGEFLGVSLWSYALALTIGLLISRVKWIRDEGMTVATMSVFILSDGFSQEQQQFSERIFELLIGVAIGVVVNLLILPPLRDRQAGRYVDSVNRRIGNLLQDMGAYFNSPQEDADDASDWVDETGAISQELDSAWSEVSFARESRKANPRNLIYRRMRQTSDPSWEEILHRTDESISHLRNLARTLRSSYDEDFDWDKGFTEEWSELAEDVGKAVADPDAEVESLSDRLDQLARHTSDNTDIASMDWPVYGALLTSLRHIVKVVDDVASARKIRETD